MSDLIIHVDNTGKIVSSDRTVRLKKNLDQATWNSQGLSGPWTIVFPSGPEPYVGSPFASSTFHVPRLGTVNSGPPLSTASDISYKYEVRGPDGNITDDPEILIEE
jgi:hypothetical protein